MSGIPVSLLGGFFRAGKEFGERDLNAGLAVAIQWDHMGELPLVVDPGYEVNAAPPANYDAFNQPRDMHRAYPLSDLMYTARGA